MHTLLPKPLPFVQFRLICDWLGYFKLCPVGCLWVHNVVPSPVYIMKLSLFLSFNAYIVNIKRLLKDKARWRKGRPNRWRLKYSSSDFCIFCICLYIFWTTFGGIRVKDWRGMHISCHLHLCVCPYAFYLDRAPKLSSKGGKEWI